MTHAYTEEVEGFTITLDLLDEDHAPDWDFESEEARDETIRKIDCGELLWFIAKVTASKNGIELATDYLGGCCYESMAQFKNDAYYEDMRTNVIHDAREVIEGLTK